MDKIYHLLAFKSSLSWGIFFSGQKSLKAKPKIFSDLSGMKFQPVKGHTFFLANMLRSSTSLRDVNRKEEMSSRYTTGKLRSFTTLTEFLSRQPLWRTLVSFWHAQFGYTLLCVKLRSPAYGQAERLYHPALTPLRTSGDPRKLLWNIEVQPWE